jgi:sugar-specific transcriptional regulator TrmB
MIKDLENLGLSKEEAKVYLALLELKTAYVSLIARKAKVNRENCYYVLDRLHKKGFVGYYMHNKLRYYTAESPKKFLYYFEDKLHSAKQILPDLMLLTQSGANRPKIHFFEGMEGVKTVFEETLESKDEILGYTDLKALQNLFPAFLEYYFDTIIENKIKTRLLSPTSDEGLKFRNKYYKTEEAKELIEILFINPAEFPFKNQVVIYENKVAMISLNEEELIGVLIESETVTDTQRIIYNLAWLGATSFVAR